MTPNPLPDHCGEAGFGVDFGFHEIGPATRQRPGPRHQELRSVMRSKPTASGNPGPCERCEVDHPWRECDGEIVAVDSWCERCGRKHTMRGQVDNCAGCGGNRFVFSPLALDETQRGQEANDA